MNDIIEIICDKYKYYSNLAQLLSIVYGRFKSESNGLNCKTFDGVNFEARK